MTALTILAIGLLGAGIAAALSLSAANDADILDPSVEERWLVKAVARRPRLASFVRRRLDRTTAGGLFLTVGFGVLLFLSVFAGWVFDTLGETRGFAAFDQSVAEFGARLDPMSTQILGLLTDLGGTPFIVGFAVTLAAYGWWHHRNRHVAYFVLAVVAGQSLVNNALKWMVERDRPAISQLTGWAGSSFPSGHSAAAAATFAAAALVLSIGKDRRVRALWAAVATMVALVVAATRALLGVHWLTDVLAGLAVGWAWFMVCAVVFGGRFMTFGEPKDEIDDLETELEFAHEEGA